MSSAVDHPHAPRRGRLALAVVALLSLMAALAFWAPASQAAPVAADAVLLETEAAPWGDTFNEEAMEAVFGTGWERQEFATVQADEAEGGLFAPQVHFIWIEGSDESTQAAKQFITEHEAALKAFVARGGRLFVNSATNQELTIEYDGRTLGPANEEDGTSAATAVDPSQPIFQGPAIPNATSFTGNEFAQGRVLGPGLTPLIVGTENSGEENGAVVLADYTSGSGRVALGTMTVVQYQHPEEAAESLRINLLTYLLSPVPEAPTPPAPAPAPAPTPEALHCVVPNVTGLKLKAAKRKLRRVHCKPGAVAVPAGVKGRAAIDALKVKRTKPKVGSVRPVGTKVRIVLKRP